MTTKNGFRHSGYLSLVLATGALIASAAFSAEPDSAAQVTIRAERAATKVVGHTSSGVPIKEYTLAYHVTFADLDLTTSTGADALKARVQQAADSLCKDLDKFYPPTEEDPTCARNAARRAMSQVNSAIKLAQSQAKSK